jgi:hypothetical protein
MPRNRLVLLIATVVIVGIAGWWFLRSGAENVAVDLIQQLPSAKQQPGGEAFAVTDVPINEETKPSIVIRNLAGSRITWPATIPDNAWLHVSIGILEEGWSVAGDGVLFSIGLGDGQVYEELLSLTINPFDNAGDRRWNDIELDLSPYAGETMQVIFNTRSGTGGRDDRNGDFAVWGEPRIVVK